MVEVNHIKHAMHVLNEAINEDDGPGSYRYGWQANLAMCISDAVNATPYNIADAGEEPEWINNPIDPTTNEGCNEIADRFLKMLFNPNMVK